ncbi:hypothetical protein DC345_15465 [Paenibacillus taichungensis]|uniref:Uncharacterized protein n=1 Tax=Paenibacillus taichungensis TaxID=484184 RepID=A0A329QPU1_9BACL|nr:hypothetical protein DC345_15465 [Paenibacillus taichungensis]
MPQGESPPPGERSVRQQGFAKASVHEARRDLKERALAGQAKRPARGVSLRRTYMRPEGASRREPAAGGAKRPATPFSR